MNTRVNLIFDAQGNPLKCLNYAERINQIHLMNQKDNVVSKFFSNGWIANFCAGCNTSKYSSYIARNLDSLHVSENKIN